MYEAGLSVGPTLVFKVSLGFCDLGNHWSHWRGLKNTDDCLGLSPIGSDLIGLGIAWAWEF